LKSMQIVRFIISLAVCFGASGIGALFMSNDSVRNWYGQLQKPSITPPDWVFGPAWTILYIMMAISIAIIWGKGLGHPKVKLAVCLFIIQLTLNALWTPLFFGYHLILAALIDIVLLFFAIFATIIVFKGISLYASILLIPYLIWVGFAALLIGLIWQLNR